MTKAQMKVEVDAGLLGRALRAKVDLDVAAEQGIRQALADAQDRPDLLAWIEQNKDALQRNAALDRSEGLVNERLRPF